VANCERCGKYVSMCVCADLPEKEDGYYHWLNRWLEQCAAWCRAFGLI